jgi:fructokinase
MRWPVFVREDLFKMFPAYFFCVILKSMRKIYTIGETVYDIIFKNSQPVLAKAGGAMLNTSVSLGRLGLPVSFISEIGEDHAGINIMDFLKENKVDTRFVDQFSDGKTALALAFLDEHEDASYSFYKLYPLERLNIDLPEPDEGDIILFGSFLAITAEVRTRLINFINAASMKESLIIYDPNFRRPHLKDLPVVKDLILENIKLSSIVRGSDEDFELIFGCINAKEAFRILTDEGCKFLVYTSSNRSVEFISDKIAFSMDIPEIKPVSTIGAGDSFNAGLIYYLFSKGITTSRLMDLDASECKEAIRIAISFGSNVCQHYDNYISKDFANRFKS